MRCGCRSGDVVTRDGSQRARLVQLQRSGRTPVRLAERASTVLLASQGLDNQQIAQRLGVTRQMAGRSRDRYAELGLAGIEKDAPRPGRTPAISDEQRAAVVRKALHEKPEGRTHSIRTTMAQATGPSDSTIGRIWRAHGLKPHRVETSKLSNDPQFVEKLRDIVGLYLSPPEHAVVLSCDEKSQIQALERTQPSLPLKPGSGRMPGRCSWPVSIEASKHSILQDGDPVSAPNNSQATIA